MDLNNSQTSVKSEFVAVVLAGFGNELPSLTRHHGEELSPKALLPIGNMPMLDYVLAWLEPSGITDVLLVCPTVHRVPIANHIHSDASASFPSLRIDLQTYGEQQGMPYGTCAILRHFSHRIERDFIVLPCDFIPPPSLPLSIILNKFRQESMLDDSILTTCWYEAPPFDKYGSNEWGATQLAASVTWDDRTGTLLHVDIPDSNGRTGDDVQLRLSILSKYPRVKLSNRLQDSTVYACNRSILEVLQKKHAFNSFRRDFVPWLCRTYYQGRSKLRVGIVAHKLDSGFAGRANSLHSYSELNRRFLEQSGQNASSIRLAQDVRA